MIDIDGHLRHAEIAYEANHSRARCPKCRLFGQLARDSSARSRRYKCRTPGCNKTMGCMEFYERYSTKYKARAIVRTKISTESELPGQRKRIGRKDHQMTDLERKASHEQRSMLSIEVPKLECVKQHISASSNSSRDAMLQGSSIRSPSSDYEMSTGSGT